MASLASSGLNESSNRVNRLVPISKPDMPHSKAMRFSFRFQNSSMTWVFNGENAREVTGGGAVKT